MTTAEEGFWGSGSWGDPGQHPLRDDLWRWNRKPARQKCSVISVELADNGANSASFAPVFIALEIGKRSGLDKYGRPTSNGASTPGTR